MTVKQQDGARGAAFSVRYCWILVTILTPLLAGGVVVGDEALLLKLAHGLDASSLSFGAYARSPDSWYIPHHILWFFIVYATAHVAAWLHAGALLAETAISFETVAAALAAIVLCFVFLVRRRALPPSYAAWTVLAFFAGGYGVYVFCMGGMAECYMVLAMAGRLFYLDAEGGVGRGWKLAVLDAVLVGLKAYSLLFIIITLPLFWAGGPKNERRGYLSVLALLLLGLGGVKLWLWNPAPIYYDIFGGLTVIEMARRWLAQFFSPWTGLLFCLPVVLVLFWHRKSDRRALALKLAGLGALAGVFSLYAFFDGDTPGGRYIFPFVIALLPEIAAAARWLLERHKRAAWLLPVAVAVFLPVAALGLPFPYKLPPSAGPCTPLHPALYSWRIALARVAGVPQTEICFRSSRYLMATQDLSSPHLGPWRVAYMLEGGHTAQYRESAHDVAQQQHDAWGAHLAERLRTVGLGSPWLWEGIGLIPAFLAMWLSIMAAWRIGAAAPAEVRSPAARPVV